MSRKTREPYGLRVAHFFMTMVIITIVLSLLVGLTAVPGALLGIFVSLMWVPLNIYVDHVRRRRRSEIKRRHREQQRFREQTRARAQAYEDRKIGNRLRKYREDYF